MLEEKWISDRAVGTGELEEKWSGCFAGGRSGSQLELLEMLLYWRRGGSQTDLLELVCAGGEVDLR